MRIFFFPKFKKKLVEFTPQKNFKKKNSKEIVIMFKSMVRKISNLNKFFVTENSEKIET